MKWVHTTAFLFLLIRLSVNAQEGWFWQNPLPQGNSLNDGFFINENYGWLVGNSGTILKTSNGGSTWINQSINKTVTLIPVYFTDINNGTIVGSNSTILKTTNKGSSWFRQSTNVYSWFEDIFYLDENNGMIVGHSDKVLKTTNGGMTFIEEETNPYQSNSFHLFQNYPNPFNPSTKIRYSVPQSSTVIIKVFDTLGNEIETLVNEEKSAGIYEVEFNSHSGEVRNLPSGVYFYRLLIGDKIETKKMILMR